MIQGDEYSLDITISNQGEALNIEDVAEIEFTLLNLVKMYPNTVSYADGKFKFPLTQEETFRLPPICPMQIRVKFCSGDVIGSEMKKISVKNSLSRAVI